jgi:FG-GAP-like repeat
VLLALLVLTPGTRGGAQAPVLVPAESSPFDVGGASGEVLLADVDDDGHLDLLTRHQQARLIRVHLGDGQAHFKTRSIVALAFAPGDMSTGDVNGDSILDVVVTASGRDLVDVLLGNGEGGLGHATGAPFAASKRRYQYNKRSLHLVDVDGDGHLDIVTGNRRGQYVFSILRGDGTGRFARGPVLKVEPAQEGYTLAFGDVDLDGDVDAVTAVSSPTRGRVDVHLNNGREVFKRLRGSVTLRSLYHIEGLADLNSDRRPDLLISHRSSLLSLLLNRRGGRFAPADGSPFDLGGRAFSVATSDLNRDDHVDLVAATVDSVTVSLGNGRAFPRARRSSFGAGPGAYHVTVGDVNEDRRPDVVASSFESSAVTVLLGR